MQTVLGADVQSGDRPSTSGSSLPGYSVCAHGGLAPTTPAPPPSYHQPHRASQQNEKKVKRKCIEVLCQPSVLLLCATVVVTGVATVMLSVSLTTKWWEEMYYEPDKINEIIEEKNLSNAAVQWLFNGRLPLVTYDKPDVNNNNNNIMMMKNHLNNLHNNNHNNNYKIQIYLFPIQSGVWISCINLEELEFDQVAMAGYRDPQCVDHLSPDSTKPTDARAAWQFRMQNLAIACAITCLILLGSAILVGLFGVFRVQNSAVLVTGVIYVLATLFAIFTLAIVHVKHKSRKDEYEPLDVWTRLINDIDDSEEFREARVVLLGWSLQLAWAGVGVCALASVMWVSVSKMMRYNPISLVS